MDAKEAIGIISATRAMVRRVESRNRDWGGFIMGVSMSPLTSASTPEDAIGFVARLYQSLRRVEAAAAHYRGFTKKLGYRGKVENMVAYARLQRSAIEQTLEASQSWVPSSGLERVGQVFVGDYCQWALDVLDAFDEWGY